MKKSLAVLTSLLCFGCISTCFATPNSSGYKTLKEMIVFTPNDPSVKAPPPILLTMGHKDGTKTRDFSLSKDSAYSEMKNLTRHHLTGDGRIGGYFVDELVGQDGQYILILAGQVYETEQNGRKIYSKHGTWMDSLGHSGSWVDTIQQEHSESALAACGGK